MIPWPVQWHHQLSATAHTRSGATSARTEKVPGPQLEEVTFDEDVVILQQVFKVGRIVDYNPRR